MQILYEHKFDSSTFIKSLTWYRCVVDFERYTFRLYFKPEFEINEPELDESELSGTNHYMEMIKQGFHTV